jgi:hypothetical protein
MVSPSELLQVADPALGEQRDRLLRPDHGCEPGVWVRGDQTGHEQGIPQAARRRDGAGSGRPRGALQADDGLVRCSDVQQGIEVLWVNRLAGRDQDLATLAGDLDRLGGGVDPIRDAGVESCRTSRCGSPWVTQSSKWSTLGS